MRLKVGAVLLLAALAVRSALCPGMVLADGAASPSVARRGEDHSCCPGESSPEKDEGALHQCCKPGPAAASAGLEPPRAVFIALTDVPAEPVPVSGGSLGTERLERPPPSPQDPFAVPASPRAPPAA